MIEIIATPRLTSQCAEGQATEGSAAYTRSYTMFHGVASFSPHPSWNGFNSPLNFPPTRHSSLLATPYHRNSNHPSASHSTPRYIKTMLIDTHTYYTHRQHHKPLYPIWVPDHSRKNKVSLTAYTDAWIETILCRKKPAAASRNNNYTR